MWPHEWPTIYSSRTIKSLKKTYVILPLYSFFILPVVLAGLTIAALGVKLYIPDEVIMKAIEISYPKRVLGIVGAAKPAASSSSTASALILANSWANIKQHIQNSEAHSQRWGTRDGEKGFQL